MKRSRLIPAAFLWIVSLALPGVTVAAPFHLVLETNADASGGNELYLTSFNSLADFMAGSIGSQGYSQIGVAPEFTTRGFAFDGSRYHLLLETDADAGGGSELYVTSFDSLADFLAFDVSAQGYSQVNVAPEFTVGGFAFDGNRYHLVLETNADASGGNELYLTSFNSLADFIGGSIGSQGYSQIGVAPEFTTRGFAFDGSQYHLLLETNADASSGNELYVTSFASLVDFLAFDVSAQGYSLVNVAPEFTVGGLAVPLSAPVPEPHITAVLLTGLAALAARRRARSRSARTASEPFAPDTEPR
jgi:hypothetical protein